MPMRKVAVMTGTRAEYGLLRPLIAELRQRPGLEVGLLVTGTHLSPVHGHTVDEIEGDGFPVWARVDALLASDNASAICKTMALTCVGMSEAMAALKPELLVGLGDRYELMAAAQAAMVHRVPIAHIHGGETTEGAIDEAIRHAVTKMAHLHFVATDAYRDRVIRMGEAPDRVFTCGALGLDNVLGLDPASREELSARLGIELPIERPVFLITYHPVTLSDRSPAEAVGELIAALDDIDDAVCIVTYPNADTLGQEIVAPMRRFVDARPDRAVLVESLGARHYLSAIKIADAVIGNSSSSIIEAPSLGVPTVDIGARQAGRIRAESVISCEEDTRAISEAIRIARTADFRERARECVNPYGDGKAAPRIAERIASHPLDGILMKSIYDGPS